MVKRTKFLQGFRSFSHRDRSVEDSMCTNSFAKRIGYVYKHRKLPRKNGVALIPEETASETSKESACSQSSISCEEHSFKVQKDKLHINVCRDTAENVIVVGHHLQDHKNLPISDLYVPVELAPNSNAMTAVRYMREENIPTQLPITCLQWPKMEQNSDVTGRSSPSKSNKLSDLDYQKGDLEDAGECSSSTNDAAAMLPDFTSTKDLCVFVLKSSGLIGEICQSSTYSPVEKCADNKSSMLCKKCGQSGNTLEMLICDFCEEAFHESCCIPRMKKLPVDHWYCKPCSRKNPGSLLNGKSRNTEVSGVKSRKYLDHIPSMLQNKKPHTTRVRIGKEFQAEVLSWSDQGNGMYDSREEPIEVDPAEYASLNTCNDWSSKSVNWVQCRATIYNGNDDEGTICGKWRRVPLHLTQSEDWDCSCALPWDPIHADCAVPQEVETDVVLKQLKLMEKLKPRLDNKRRRIG